MSAVLWSPPPWSTVGAVGPEQRTPDLSVVLSEIVNRPGWASGQSLVFLISGTGRRVAASQDGDPAGAPTLHIEYGGGSIPVAVGDGPAPGFAIHAVSPTPSRGVIRVELSLPDRSPARMELIDVAGRRVATRDLGSLGPGHHRVDLAAGLRAGVYLVRLTRGGRARTAKAVVLD